jgi:two-component system, NarL family, response regulator DevR
MGRRAPLAHTSGMQNAHQETRPVAVFIAEDHAPVRERVVALLNTAGGFSVVGQAETPAAAIEGILRDRPDAVVLDIHLIGGTGLEVLRAVHPVQPDIRFVVLTNHSNAQYRKACMDAGAGCVLDKTTDFLSLPATLKAAA